LRDVVILRIHPMLGEVFNLDLPECAPTYM
jgi:hypothetical protein